LPHSELPRVVDAEWLREHLDDVVVGDMRGHIPGSRPLVLGSPPPGADESSVAELAKEVALRLRRHGITGNEKLVLADRGDGVGAMPAAQMAELAGHPNVAILLGGVAGWTGELAQGAVELEPVREASLQPNARAFPTRQEISSRLEDPSLTLLDVRREEEYTGKAGSACDPRQGHIPGARRLQVDELFGADGNPKPADEIRALVGDADEIVAYCHSGSRSALATLALRSAGYDARNYAGSWHEWSRHPELPLER
jgi:thiosulfate/3-mercaptopyruvate sulfurtransferase